MFQRLFPPLIVGVIALGNSILAVFMGLGIFFCVCAAAAPQWFMDLPGWVHSLTLALSAPAAIGAFGIVFAMPDCEATFLLGGFLGQTLGYWLLGHAINYLVRTMKN